MSRLSFLHSLCRDGKQKELEKYFSDLDSSEALEILRSREGPFKYALLHTATVHGHASLLHFLLNKGADPNAQASNGWTALHLAASGGRVECVKVLLSHKADPRVVDEYGKTARQLTALKNITRWLMSQEIVMTVEAEGNVTQLLSECNGDDLEEDTLDQALETAVRLGSMRSISSLLMKGANIKAALDVVDKSEDNAKLYVTLLLVKAAVTNDCDPVKILHGETKVFPEWIHTCAQKGNLSYTLPIEMAQQKGHSEVTSELLVRTGIQEKSVDWSQFRLRHLEANVFERIDFVEYLTLRNNCLETLPSTASLKQLVKAELQSNFLSTVPASLLELPLLKQLNLSDNRITNLPELREWSSSLSTLDLSHNRLTTIPGEPLAPSIRTLNLADNDFRTVPLCVCNFITLRLLDISDNKNILSLPPQMGKLKGIITLNLKGLKDLNEPPKNIQSDVNECIRYLRNKLVAARGFYRIKLMLVGKQNRGKTTLVARLQGRDCGNESTVGVDVSEWEYKMGQGKKFSFSIWDFGGQEEYYATHQCFLSERSIYLLLFNLKDGDAGVNELTPWLENIALRAPRSCVFIVGTHLDEIPAKDRAHIDTLLKQAGDMASKFSSKLQIKEVLGVGLKKQLENVNSLRESIYNCAAQYVVEKEPVMGQMVPSSYHILDKHIQDLQKEVRNGTREPVMHKEEYKSLIHQLNLSDIQDEDELKTATLFLNNVGTLLHYDDRSHNLDELYFIDPRWLCEMMAKIVTIRERNPFIVDGILHIRNVPFLLHDQKFPAKYFKQYLTLLDRFEIAFALDTQRIIIPSQLPERRPAGIDIKGASGKPLYTRYLLFTSASTPPGFWSRLISRIMHSVSRLQFILDQHIEHSDANVPNEWGIGGMFDSHSEMRPPDALDATCSLNYVDLSQVRVQYWRTGIFYNDGEVLFRVESLRNSKQCTRENREGVLIAVSPNAHGRTLIAQLVDLTASLFKDWYQGGTMEQVAPCYECMSLKRPLPFEFRIDSCHSLIAQNQSTIQCQYSRHDSLKNHTASLLDIVPDLLLIDLSSQFILKSSEVIYEESRESLLGKGGYGTVYRGVCRGQSVAIKKYQSDTEEAFCELRREATLLQKFRHPCLVCLVGVCVHPLMALVLEEAPMGSLESPLIKIKQPIHRVVIHRIVAQVAAALKFLHNNGVIFRDLKAANVLLWSLDPESLCHCKVTDFGVATNVVAIGARGVQGTKGFIAPEMLYVGKRTERAVYNHRVDVFSFGMLLYQMIARRHPFHDVLNVKIDSAVEKGERPKLQDVPQAENAYFYLTRLMKQCWQGDPRQRPTTSEIIDKVSLSTFQSVMSVQPVRSRLSLRHACVITSTDLTEANVTRENELWVCCDGAEGTEISVYTTNTMTKVSKNFIKDNQVRCISLCGDHVWVASRVGIECEAISIFNLHTRELVHSIPMKDTSVCCMTYWRQRVYCGTLEGWCILFSSDVRQLGGNVQKTRISTESVDSILVIEECLWLSHTQSITLLNPNTLLVQSSLTRGNDNKSFIGILKVSADIVWGIHLPYSSCLSAWSVPLRRHLFDVDVSKHWSTIDPSIRKDVPITAMTLALDTVWVGTGTGHILVFHQEQLLTWFCPYKEYVRFLVCIPCEGPCRTEKAMVVSGGKGFSSPMIPGLPDYDKMDEKGDPVDKAGTLIIWEAFPSKMCRQISMIQSQSSTILDSHNNVEDVTDRGGFKCLPNITSIAPGPLDQAQSNPSSVITNSTHTVHKSQSIAKVVDDSVCELSHSTATEMLELKVCSTAGSNAVVHLRCPKPVQLQTVITEVAKAAGLSTDKCCIEYQTSTSVDYIPITSQSDLDLYLQLVVPRPLLLLTA